MKKNPMHEENNTYTSRLVFTAYTHISIQILRFLESDRIPNNKLLVCVSSKGEKKKES